MRSIWDPSLPPDVRGVSRHEAAMFKSACDNILARGMLAVLQVRVRRLWGGTTSAGKSYGVHFECVTADRLTGEPVTVVFPGEFSADMIGASNLSLEDILRQQLRDMFEHEWDESIWDGKSETDPHRFDEAK